MGFFSKTDRTQKLMSTIRHFGLTQTREFAHRHHHVLQRGEFKHQEVKLKNEADVFTPGSGSSEVIGIRHNLGVYRDFPAVRLIEKTQQVEQSRLTAARGTNNCINLPPVGLEGNSLKHMNPAVSVAQIPVQVSATQSGFT